MKVLIAIISYAGDSFNGNHDKIRESWGKDCPAAGVDLRFFVGRRHPNYQPKPDEVLIDWEQNKNCSHPWYESSKNCCVDFWQLLTKEAIRWALAHGFDYIFLAENDTFLVPKKLMQTGFEKYDLSGYLIQGGESFSWPEPGAGYFLSKKGMEILLAAPPDHWSLGMYAGYVLGAAAERGEATMVSLPNFWREATWHFRFEFNGDGYSPGSPWQATMQAAYGEK